MSLLAEQTTKAFYPIPALLLVLTFVCPIAADDSTQATRAALRYVAVLESEFSPAEQKLDAARLLARLGPHGVAAAPILADIICVQAPREEFAIIQQPDTCFLVKILARMGASKDEVLPQLTRALRTAKERRLRSHLAGLILFLDGANTLARSVLEDAGNSDYFFEGLSFAGLETCARLMEAGEGRLAVPAAELLLVHSPEFKEQALATLVRWMHDEGVGLQAGRAVLSKSNGPARAMALDVIYDAAVKSHLQGPQRQLEAAQMFARYEKSNQNRKQAVAAAMSTIARSSEAASGTRISAARLADELNDVEKKGQNVEALMRTLDGLRDSQTPLTEPSPWRTFAKKMSDRTRPNTKNKPSSEEIAVINEVATLAKTSELARYYYHETIFTRYDLPAITADLLDIHRLQFLE